MNRLRLNGDEFLIAFSSYFGSEGGRSASKFLNERRYPISNLVPSRILNHWEKEGVIDDDRKEGRGWRVYSAIHLIWFHIILELREFSVSLVQLKGLKSSLERMSNNLEHSKMPELELYLRQSMINSKPFYLLIFKEGDGIIAFESELKALKSLNNLPNHISIDLFQIFKRVFPKMNLQPSFELDWKLSQAEEQLISDIRSNRFESIEIQLDGSEIKRYQIEEIIRDKKLFRNIALDYPFQTIETIIKDNKTVGMKRKISKKFK